MESVAQKETGNCTERVRYFQDSTEHACAFEGRVQRLLYGFDTSSVRMVVVQVYFMPQFSPRYCCTNVNVFREQCLLFAFQTSVSK